MEPLPLIPKTLNHDSSHIIREAFQEVLGSSILQKDLADNLEKYKMKMEPLKICGADSNKIYSAHEKTVKDIDEIENKFLQRKAEYLIAKDLIVQNDVVNEIIKLKRQAIYRKLDQPSVKKYGLLEYDSLLPSIAERAIDFRLNSNTHLCSPPCKPTGEDLPPIGKPATSGEKAANFRSRKLKNEYDETKKHQADVDFQAIPEQLIFYNYELNVEYKKKIKLKNITNKVQKINLKSPLLSRYFGVYLESTSKIASGMSAIFCVTYKTDIYNDVRETVSFRTNSGQELDVQLVSQRDAPVLQAYIVRYDRIPTNPEELCSSRSSCNIDRTIALNSTIDCGFSFIGKEMKLSMITKNEGGRAKFFIMSEQDWFSLNVEDINLNLELCAGVFHVCPVYFEIACDEFVNINISFYPKKYGLFVQTIYVLCSNNTFLPLDLIGDGIYFETSFITFDLPKKDGKPYFLDFDSNYCLHIDECLTCNEAYATIKVNNNSALNLPYRWNVRKSENDSDFKFKHMPPHWINIKPVLCLHSYSTNEFELTVFPEVREGGFYHIVLSLYIENIPEASLLDRETFIVTERSDYSESKLLDVLVGEIEVLCDVQAVKVVIEPNPLNIPCLLTRNDLHKQSFSVVNCTNFQLQCKWLPHRSNINAVINPEHFVLNQNYHCVIYIFPESYEDLEAEFILDVNEGSYKDIFLVTAKINVPTISLSTSTVNFGIILTALTYKQTLYVENNSSETVSWSLVEDREQTSGNVESFNDPMTIRPNNGILGEKEKCLVEYVANNENLGEWSSHIKLYTNFSKTDVPVFVCSVHFMVCAPDILIHTNTSEMPILCPQDILHLGVLTEHHVCLHNGGCVDSVFAFGKPTGKAANDFEITVLPRLGNIRAKENVHVDIKITPLKMGYYEDIFIPCFFLGIDYAFAVRLMCVVGDVMVNIYLPNEFGNYNIILWPELKICESCYCEDGIGEHGSNAMSVENEYDEVKMFFENSDVKGEDEDEYRESDESGVSDIDKTYGINERLLMSRSNKDVKIIPLTFSSSTSSSSSSSFSESVCLLTLKEKVKELFGKDLKLQNNILSFENVPLKTPVKKIIKIENLTAGYGVVYMEVTNLYCIEQEEDCVRDAMITMNLRKSNEWEDIVSSEGVTIKIQPPGKNLNPFETIEIEIWVYANTWGYYVDELVMDISELASFCVTVIVEAVGVAVDFPLAVNTICNQPTVRLGIVPVKSEKIQRKIKVSNTSMVPVFVTWHCFLKRKPETGPDRYFGIFFDMNDPDTEDDVRVVGEVKLLKENLGVATNTHFEIDPELMLIQPKSHGYINLTIRVSCFNQDYFYKRIEGYVIGSIHLYKKFKFQQNLYYRPTGMNISLVKLRIMGKLEVPHLHLDDLPQEIDITAYASDIVKNHKFTKTKKLIFKNRRLSEALIYMVTEDPFKIISVKTLRYDEFEFLNYVNVKPNECLEIILKCEIHDTDALKLAPRIRLAENMRILSRNLIIYQRSAIQVEIPISLVIFYPSFKVTPKEIMFSTVFIGNVAKSMLTLKNLTAAPIPFQIVKSTKCKELIIVPSSGIMQPQSTGEDVIISVFFQPKDPITYKVSVIIASNIPRFEETVEIIGMGSYNETFYVPGKH